MKQRLFVTLSLAGLAMATFGATKPKTAIKSLNKTTIQQPTYTEWHDLQVNAINRFPLHTNFFTYPADDWVYEKDGKICLLYTSPSPRDGLLSRMPSSA